MPWPVACKPSPGLIKKVTGEDCDVGLMRTYATLLAEHIRVNTVHPTGGR